VQGAGEAAHRPKGQHRCWHLGVHVHGSVTRLYQGP
jgi:hypothetical protein